MTQNLIRSVLVWSGTFTMSICTVPIAASTHSQRVQVHPTISTRGIPLLHQNARRFRDLNRNGRLEIYEDWRRPARERARDLVSRMSLAEKAGQMVVANAFSNAPFGQPAGGYNMDMVGGLVKGHHVTYFNSMLVLPAPELARAHNRIQELAEQGRHGIPVVMASDPRHHFQHTVGASVGAGDFSQWPEPIGLAAIGDAALMKRFGDKVRRDFRAVGFSLLLGPQLDIATEPRWPRNNGTLGEDPTRAGALAAAYVEGAQGSRLGPTAQGIATVVKHFVGYSAGKHGWDAHNRYGRVAVSAPDTLPLHLRPFERAFEVHPSSVMPSYAILEGGTIDGQPIEPVGAAYSKVLISDLLRKRYKFRGVVLTDWAVTEDCEQICTNGFPAGQRPTFEGISMAWGVEQLTKQQRFARALSVGVDQFGGVMDPTPIIEAANAGLITQRNIDDAATRILTQTFQLGLFEAPFVDPEAAALVVGSTSDESAAREAQSRSMVVLEARRGRVEPGARVFLHGADPEAATAAGLTVVSNAEDAELAIIRTATPFQTLHPNYFFGSMQHEGSLEFPRNHPDLQLFRNLSKKIPVIVDVYLDRPAILTPLKEEAAVLIASFGASDGALFDLLTGRERARGTLPFELPRSMAAVVAQRPDKPADSPRPLYPLHYSGTDNAARLLKR